MKAQFPRALHREKECAGHGVRGEKTCGQRTRIGEATLCRAVRRRSAAAIVAQCTRRRLEVVRRSKFESQAGMPATILPIDRPFDCRTISAASSVRLCGK
jgi:hypothetical protein